MSERSEVTLTILASQREAAEKILGNTWDSTHTPEDHLIDYEFSEIKAGDLSFLRDLLAAGIAYNSLWDRTRDYDSGTQYCRFDEHGNSVLKTIYEVGKNPRIDSLMKIIDEPEKLRDYLIQHVESLRVLPWDNQEEYGKRYRMTQLLIK